MTKETGRKGGKEKGREAKAERGGEKGKNVESSVRLSIRRRQKHVVGLDTLKVTCDLDKSSFSGV